MDNLVKISYTNDTDVVGSGETIHYSNGIGLFSFALVGEILQAPSENEVEKKRQGDLEKPVETITKQKVEFSVFATDKTKLVLENLVHHKTVSFEYKGVTYDAKIPVEVSFEYVTPADLMKCKILVTYEYTVSRESTLTVTINTL